MDTLLLKPIEVGNQLRISRAKTYELIASGEIPSIKVGGTTRVPAVALQQWIDRQVSERATERAEDDEGRPAVASR
jgi:excisionase family DNA binding protein